MKIQIKITKSQGKTVEAVEWGEELLITFTDGTFAYIRVGVGYEGEPQLEMFRKFEPLDCDTSYDNQVDIGIVTREEIENLKKQKERQQEKSDLAQYKRLRVRFGNKN